MGSFWGFVCRQPPPANPFSKPPKHRGAHAEITGGSGGIIRWWNGSQNFSAVAGHFKILNSLCWRDPHDLKARLLWEDPVTRVHIATTLAGYATCWGWVSILCAQIFGVQCADLWCAECLRNFSTIFSTSWRINKKHGCSQGTQNTICPETITELIRFRVLRCKNYVTAKEINSPRGPNSPEITVRISVKSPVGNTAPKNNSKTISET